MPIKFLVFGGVVSGSSFLFMGAWIFLSLEHFTGVSFENWMTFPDVYLENLLELSLIS